MVFLINLEELLLGGSKMIKSFLRQNKFTKTAYANAKKKWKRYWIQKNGIKELSVVTKVLNKNGILAFADFGTLLGLVREKRLLKHDLDIDIGVINSNNTCKKIEKIFNRLNYKKSREFMVDGIVAEQSFVKKRIKIDIQYYFDLEDGMFCYLFYNKNLIKEGYWQAVKKKCSKVNNVQMIDIKNHSIYIPNNAEDLLVDKYGDNWRTPDTGWLYWEGPNTIKADVLGKLV